MVIITKGSKFQCEIAFTLDIQYNSIAVFDFPFKVSFVNSGNEENGSEKIAFNYGRELFVYSYRGVRKAADLTKPIDKRVYKGTCPTCHDFGPPGCLKNENVGKFFRDLLSPSFL